MLRSLKLSDLGKRARAVKDDCHTTGSKSYAQKRNDFVEKHKRDPSNLEFWKETHQRKDGSYVENTTTEEFMETAQDLVDKNMAASSEKSRIVVENEVFNELMYDKDILNQRLIGYGHGVCRSQIFSWQANLRKRIGGDDSIGEDAVKEEFEILRQENKQLQHTCASMATQLSRITSFLLKHGVVLDDSEEGVNMNSENAMRGASSRHNDQSANSSFSRPSS